VPKALRSKTISLRTSDGVRLSAMVLGTGKRGVVLSHEQGYNICSWLALGQTLASRGYHVMLPEYRFHGASAGKSNDHLDRDLTAAVKELTRRGATRIVAGGASCGGSTSVVLAPKISGFTGLIGMSSPRVCGDLNALKVVKTIRQPSFFAFSPGDMNFEAEVRRLHKASGARDKRLVIARGGCTERTCCGIPPTRACCAPGCSRSWTTLTARPADTRRSPRLSRPAPGQPRH
jgi:hypothetical protein